MLLSFFSWWYGAGWAQVANSLKSRLQGVTAAFSVRQLLQTLFAPWKRIITYPGNSLDERLRAWGDNIFSRCIGFIIRLFVLSTAGVVYLLIGLVTILELAAWPLLPLAVPGLLIAGVLL